ncbi:MULTISPECIES: hypothetical protein [Sorangium]|nr:MULTISPECIES: hypothetical protein [Sorangium]
MKIHSDQLTVFQQDALRRFEMDMVEHLRQFSPIHSDLMGDRALRELIRFGADQANRYGFSKRGPVRLYIELIFILGVDFDTDPQLPWTKEILRDPNFSDQMLRAKQLYERALFYIERVTGPDYHLSRTAIGRVFQGRIVDSRVSAEYISDEVVEYLYGIHPQKCEYVGRPVLHEIYRKALQLAEQHGIGCYSGVALCAGLMLVFGHGFIHDPKIPWVSAVFAARPAHEPETWLNEFYSLAMAYLTRIAEMARGERLVY